MKLGLIILALTITLIVLWFLITRIAIPSYYAGFLIVDSNSKRFTDLPTAVMSSSVTGVNRLIMEKADLETTDKKGQTALILAAKTDQFYIAEKLITAGANIWAVSNFGWTVGYAVETSNQNSPERKRVSDLLKEKGFPTPAPTPDEVLEMVKKGAWPPH